MDVTSKPGVSFIPGYFPLLVFCLQQWNSAMLCAVQLFWDVTAGVSVSTSSLVFSIFLLLYSLGWPAQLWWSLLLSWLFLVCNLDLACGGRGNQCLARNRNRQQRGKKHVRKRASFLGGLKPKCMWRRLEEEVHITVPTSTIKSLSPHHHSILTLACSVCISIMGWTWLSLLLTYSCTICLWKEAARQFQRNLLLTEHWCSGSPDP